MAPRKLAPLPPVNSPEAAPQSAPTVGQETEAQARARSAACHADIVEVLHRYRCQLVPFIQQPETVGGDARRMMLTAAYAIVPNL